MSESKNKQTFLKSSLPKKCKLSINKEVLQKHNNLNIKVFQKQAQIIKKSNNKPKGLTDSLKELKLLKENTVSVIADRYNTYERDYNIFMIDLLLINKSCKIVTKFKDHLIYNNNDEYLRRRIYRIVESSDKIGKIANHYKNYLLFFCKPLFKEFQTNAILLGYGDMKAELFYKNNYCQKNEDQNNHNCVVINTDFSAVNYENIKTLFNATIREDIEKTFITRTVTEDKENLVIPTNEKESFAYNSHRGDYSYNLNTVKSGLISKRSHNNSIENILNNLDENYSNINERIIDKIQKNKKTVRNNYSTTDKTKPEENIFNTNAKLKQPLKDKEDDINSESKKVFTANKSTHCLFNSTKMNNQTVRQVINPEYTLSRAKCIPQQKNKINIKLKYKDVKELMSDKSPLGEHQNSIKFSSKINEYKELNLKKNQINAFHNNKSCDPKYLEYSNKNIEQNIKKNHSTKISEKNKNSLFININSEKNLKEPVINKATRNLNSINTLKSTITIIPKKDRIIEKKNEEMKAENKIKDIINHPQLNITKSIFTNNIQSKASMYSSNNVNIASAKIFNKKEVNINNYHSHNDISTKNSRNQKHSIYKNNSNFDLTNPETYTNKIRNKSKGKNNSIEQNKIDKLVYNSCINLQQGSEKVKNSIKSKESRSLSKNVNNFIKEKINEFLEKDNKKKLNYYKQNNRSTSRNDNHNLVKQTTTMLNNLKTSKINLEIDKIVKQKKIKHITEYKLDMQSNSIKNSNSSSKIRLLSHNKKKE